MTTYEIISIVLVVTNALLSVSSIIVPMLINRWNNRDKLLAEKEKDEREKFNNYFEKIKQAYEDLTIKFIRWEEEQTLANKEHLLFSAYQMMHIAMPIIHGRLYYFCEAVKSDNVKDAKKHFEDVAQYSGLDYLRHEWEKDDHDEKHSNRLIRRSK